MHQSSKMKHMRGRPPQATHQPMNQGGNRENRKNYLQLNGSHKYFISKLVVAGVKDDGAFTASKAYV